MGVPATRPLPQTRPHLLSHVPAGISPRFHCMGSRGEASREQHRNSVVSKPSFVLTRDMCFSPTLALGGRWAVEPQHASGQKLCILANSGMTDLLPSGELPDLPRTCSFGSETFTLRPPGARMAPGIRDQHISAQRQHVVRKTRKRQTFGNSGYGPDTCR